MAHAGEPADRIVKEEKLAALWTLVTLGDKQSEGQLVSVAKTLQNDSRPSLAQRAGFILTWHRMRNLRTIEDPADREKRRRHRGRCRAAAYQAEFDERLIVLADQLTTHLEHPYPRLALSAAEDFAAAGLARRRTLAADSRVSRRAGRALAACRTNGRNPGESGRRRPARRERPAGAHRVAVLLGYVV